MMKLILRIVLENSFDSFKSSVKLNERKLPKVPIGRRKFTFSQTWVVKYLKPFEMRLIYHWQWTYE